MRDADDHSGGGEPSSRELRVEMAGGAIDELFAAAAHGDRDAFATFYDHTASTVFGLMWGALGNSDAAVQATERVYLRAWASAPCRHRERSAEEFLLSIAHRELIARRDIVAFPLLPPIELVGDVVRAQRETLW